MPKLTESQRLEMISEYENNHSHTIRSIAKKYNVDSSSACTLFQRRGIKIRKNPSLWNRTYSINEKYFEKIDTEDKAYFLGLMYADGNIFGSRMKIGLQEKDKNILEKFKKYIKYNGPLMLRKGGKRDDGWGVRKNQYILQIVNQKISKSLSNLGCIPKKSLVLQFPTEKQVPKKWIRHFIRGVMDGDGYFSKYNIKANKTTKMQVCLVSTIMFLEKLTTILKEELDINTFITKRHKERNTVTRQMFISGTNQVTKFLNWIYKDSTVSLDRKYLKYKEIING